MEHGSSSALPSAQPRWRAISARDRRVAGVLVEKAKTTPDQYPMSLNAVRSGANQKNNRYPQMELELDQVQESLDRLRSLGAVSLVQSGGRVERYRHQLYEWLAVDKVELAVMAELLLRGAQTEGELRTRASRMEPINDLPVLREILDRLAAKNLIVSLSPPGRGHVITHNLYREEELERLRAEYAGGASQRYEEEAKPVAPASREQGASSPADSLIAGSDCETQGAKGAIAHEPAYQQELQKLRSELAETRSMVDQLSTAVQTLQHGLEELRDSLGGA